MSNLPIAEHALLSDCQSAAPVTVDGSVGLAVFPAFRQPVGLRPARHIGLVNAAWAIAEAEHRQKRVVKAGAAFPSTPGSAHLNDIREPAPARCRDGVKFSPPPVRSS
jgi:hypothetical protein